MVHNEDNLSNRDFTFILDCLKWLDQEITRYRDIEWKATSFHAAFFIALLYSLLDVDRRQYLLDHRVWFTITILLYLGVACFQLIYIHRRLNIRRNERSHFLSRIGESAPSNITSFFIFWEGAGAIFPIGFISSLIFLAITILLMLEG